MNKLDKVALFAIIAFVLFAGVILWFLNSDLSSTMDISSIKFYLAFVIIFQLFSIVLMIVLNQEMI